MTLLRPTGSQWRTPEIGKSYIVSTDRGVTRVQGWPRKRGPARTTDDKHRQLVFSLFQDLIKRLDCRDTLPEREGLRVHNQTHRGQRGSAAIRYRDWITQRLYGRGVAVTTPIGVTFYPPGVSRDATAILDHISDQPGAILQRDLSGWSSPAIGHLGQVLTAGSAGQPATWQPLL